MPCPPLSPEREYYIHDGPDVRVTVSNPSQSRSESTVVVNPTNAKNLICASKKFIDPHKYHFTISASYSDNGGATWTESQPPLQPGWDGMTDPDLTFDAAGNAYLIVEPLVFGATDISGLGMYVFKSTDGGHSWHKPVLLHLDHADDKQWIEADTSPTSPHYGNVYAIWGANTPLRFARSSDQGATWKGIGVLPSGSDVSPDPCYAPSIALSDDGTIHVTWHIPTTWEIKYTRSTDGGNTFSPVVTVVTGVYSLTNFLPSVGGFPQFPGGTFRVMTVVSCCIVAGSTLVVAWADYREGVSRIYYRTATANGTNWLGPNNGQPLIAGASNASQQHFHPQMSTAADNAVGCAFYEFGPKPQKPLIDVRVAFSCSDGAAFSVPITITDNPWDPAVNAPWSHGNPAATFIGDYFGFIGGKTSFDVVWTDTRTGVQELFFDNVKISTRSIFSLVNIPAATLEILAGVIQDGGGLVFVGGKIIRIPPWDPWIEVLRAILAADTAQNRTPGQQDAVSALQATFQPPAQLRGDVAGKAKGSAEKT
jgi:hypothetical protein